MTEQSYNLEYRNGTLDLDASGQLTSLTYTPGSGLPALQLPVTLTWQMGTGSAAEPVSILQPPDLACGNYLDKAATFETDCAGIRLEIKVSVDGVGPNWTATLLNTSGQRLDWFKFTLTGIWGLSTAPTATIPLLAGWMLPLDTLENGDSIGLDYPVRASMQWTDLFTPDHGIYFGVHDSIPLLKQLEIRKAHDRVSVSWRFSDLALDPGCSIMLPPVYLVAHSGDWHAGADIYRTWAAGYVTTPIVPAWYQRKPAWAWAGLRGQYEALPWHTTADIPLLSESAASCGIDCIQLTAYTEQGHDTLYPDYRVGPSIGGDEGMRQAVARIHNAGRRITIYTNGRIVDPASSLTQQQRADWAVRPSPQRVCAHEAYGKVMFDIMCPGAGAWRTLFIERLAYLVQSYNVDGIFIDQVSAAASLPCYAGQHDHQSPNLAWSNYRVMLSDLRARLKGLNPDLILTSEGVSDFFGQYLDSQQAHQDWPIPLQPKTVPLEALFRYTFPDFILNSGCITGDANGITYLKVAYLLGSGFDVGIADWTAISCELCGAMRFAVEWRARMAPMLAAAPDEMNLRQPGMKANLFTSTINGHRVRLVHTAWLPVHANQVRPGCVDLSIPMLSDESVHDVLAESPSGKLAAQWHVIDGVLQLQLPFSELAAIYIY